MHRDSQPPVVAEPNLPRRTMVQGAGALVAGALAAMLHTPATAAVPATESAKTTRKTAKKRKKNDKRIEFLTDDTAAGRLLSVTSAFANVGTDGEETVMCNAMCPPARAGQRVVALSVKWVGPAHLSVIASFANDTFDGLDPLGSKQH